MRYRAHGAVSGSKFIGEFDAETVEEALRIAEAEAGASFCHRCSGECQDPEVEVVALTDADTGATLWEGGDAVEGRDASDADAEARQDAVEHLAEAMRLLFALHPELNADDASGVDPDALRNAVELRRRIREASGCVEAIGGGPWAR